MELRDMTYSQHIAAVLGPALVLVTLSEAIHLDIWEDVHPTVVYLNGLLFVIGGLFIATTHNLWVPDWRVMVTLSGWLMVIAGAYRMFAPEGQQLGPGPLTYAAIALLGCLDLVLSWFAFLTSGTPSHGS
jgi:hypothetical protein